MTSPDLNDNTSASTQDDTLLSLMNKSFVSSKYSWLLYQNQTNVQLFLSHIEQQKKQEQIVLEPSFSLFQIIFRGKKIWVKTFWVKFF